MCGTSISSTCLSTGDRQAPTAFFLWRNVFCSLYVLWAPPISYCIFLWENIFLHFVCALSTANILLHYSSEESFLQFECALSTANVLLNSSCEESFSAVWMCSEHRQSPTAVFLWRIIFFSMCNSTINWKIWSEAASHGTFWKVHLNLHPWSHRSPQYSPSAFVAGGRWWPQPTLWHMR